MTDLDSLIIKICGLTTLADARYAASLGATHLGFIQYPKSQRFLPPEEVAEILEWIFGVTSVGVFVNETATTINAAAQTAGFDWVQLHGDEDPETCARIGPPVIKAFRIRVDDTVDSVASLMHTYSSVVRYFLIDAYSEVEYGGTGLRIPLDIAAGLSERFPVILSGGLSPENVAESVTHVSPVGIDVSSSLETAPGIKDYERMDSFFEHLRGVRI